MIVRFLLPLLLVIIGLASFADGGWFIGTACELAAVALFFIAALIPGAP